MSGILKDAKFVASDGILALGRGTTIFGDMLEDFESPIQATVIDRLVAEGVTLLDSVKIDDLASIVAKGEASFGLGFDIDGKVRLAASQNGLFGYKPTYGMVSRHGLVAMTSSMDTVSIVAESVEQIEQVSGVISGPDGQDAMLFSDPVTTPAEVVRDRGVTGRVGVVREFTNGKLAFEEKSEEVTLAMAEYVLAIYHTIMPAEVYSNMMQYDGIRYGKRPKNTKDWADIIAKSRGEGFDKETKLNVMIGAHVLSSEMFEAYFVQAARARTMLINELNDLFAKYDFLLGSADSQTMMAAAALAGLPSLSLPNGMQIIGPMKSDAELLNFAKGIKK